MPIITDITRQKRNQDFYNVYVDDKFSFSLGRLDLGLLDLKISQEFSKRALQELITKSQSSKAYNRAIHYLSFRPRSISEVKDYLLKKDFNDQVVEQTITKLQQLALLDDEKFIEVWVSSRNQLKPRSKLQLRHELQAKKIDKELIAQALADISDSEELNLIKKVIASKKRQPKYQDKQKLLAYLLRQGFSYNLIKQALVDSSG